MLYIVAAILVIALVILVIGLYFGLKSDESDLPPRIPEEQRGGCKVDTEFQNFSVSTDTAVCSKIGCDILTKKGSAVDAAIAAMLCIGVVTMHSSGIGGGAFMLIYERQNRKATFVNARETAPGTAHKDVYVNNKNESKYGKGMCFMNISDIDFRLGC